ncbi:MAG: hypothetical protein AAGI11_16615 [Pseudomonadota bacterium]
MACIRSILASSGLSLLLAAPTQADDYDRLMQAFVGALRLDDQQGDLLDESGQPIDIEFPTLPSLGLEGEYRYGGQFVTYGLNPGGSFAWKSGGTSIAGGFNGSTGGTIRIDIDNSFFFGELHLGGYIRGRLGKSVTVYAAAGPMIAYGRMKVEDEEIDIDDSVEIETSSVSDFGFGYYGRAGIDFAIKGEQAIGLGLRYMRTELDLDDTVGNIDIEGPQVIFSYTVPL